MYGWYVDVSAHDDPEEAYRIVVQLKNGIVYIPVIPETVSQQVGLKDRDGIEEVYGNDLMKDLLHTYRVCWVELDAGFRLIDIEEPKNQLRGEAIRLLTKMGTIHDEEAEA